VPGLVSLIGVGPGDPGLLTLRGARAIGRADTVLYDALVHPAVLAHARPEAERLFVGKRAGQPSATQEEINHMLLYRAGQGRRVARLKGGDPLLFGRGAEEMEFLAQHGVAFEVVPGVTAALGATAYAGIPLSHRDLSSSLALVTSTERPGRDRSRHDWARLATATQTLVVYMGLGRLRDDLATLVAHGRAADTPAAVIALGTHPEQVVVTATVGTLADAVDAAKPPSPALVVVGDVVSLRARLAWWDRGPLFGRRVVVTRAESQSQRSPSCSPRPALRCARCPCSTSRPRATRAPSPSRSKPCGPAPTPWPSSPAATPCRASSTPCAPRASTPAPWGAASSPRWGKAPPRPCAPRASSPTWWPPRPAPKACSRRSAHIPDSPSSARGCSCRARSRPATVLVDGLRAAGCTVDVAPVYRTVPASRDAGPALRHALSAGEVDAVVLTAGSAVASLCDLLGDDAPALLARIAVVSLGPVTTQALRARGIAVAAEAATPSDAGLLDALCQHFAKHTPA
jgi:uroporphyrinogen III methyltransferase/synthase